MKVSLGYRPFCSAGFSLVEMLIYIALLTIVCGGALTVLFSMGDQINAGRAERRMGDSAQGALERMLSDIRAADAVDVVGSTLGTHPGVLSLTQDANTTEFAVSGDAITVSVNGVNQGPLTNDSVTVDDLRFYRYDNANTELVRIDLTLTATAGDASITRTFNSAAVLRGSYE